MTDVSLYGAFLAGLVSFLSPCVLPLVPGYISMLSGIGVEQLRQGQQPRTGLFASSVAFVVGFSVVFISFGATASAVGTFLQQNRSFLGLLARFRCRPLFAVLGYIHFFSLSLIGFFGPAMTRWLNRDVRLRTSSTQPGIWSGFLLGFAFAFGWTPCIGPILTTVLALAHASDTIARGALLLPVSSGGLEVP